MVIKALLCVAVIIVAALFSASVIVSAWRKYVGHNATAPGLWSRIRAWWPGFVKRHIVDWNPYEDESHAKTRYRDDYIDWSKVPEGYDFVAVDGPDTDWSNKVWAYAITIAGDFLELQETRWITKSGNGHAYNVDDAIIGPLPPWRESLRRRPK